MELSAEARGGTVQGASASQAFEGQERMLESVSDRLQSMHKHQVHRDPWPDFSQFDVSAYPQALRRAAAVQWAGRARAEHGSVHQFSALTHALCEARAPLPILGALTRLQTDEVRHAEMCAEMARSCYPEGISEEPSIFAWPQPTAPWADAPRPAEDGSAREIELWAACAIVSACCLGEALSKPMLDAIALVSTDTVCKSVAKQILRDEHLHAAFGFEALGWLLSTMDDDGRITVQQKLRTSLGSLERTTACGITAAEIAESRIEIKASPEPNLGTLSDHQYAMIFFSTLEFEIFPKLEALGLDPTEAWASRV